MAIIGDYEENGRTIYVTFDGGEYSESSLHALELKGQVIWDWRWFRSPTSPMVRPMSMQATRSTTTVDWHVGVVGEVGYVHSGTTLTFAAGPRVTGVPPGRTFTFFGQFLAGALHFSGENGGDGVSDMLLIPGGGVEIGVPNQRFLIDVQLDFPLDFFEGTHEAARRISFGVTLPLASKK
jgi:hypothetical protein